jgi:predicted flavoprotein YhiN
MISQSGLEGGAVYALSRWLREAADAATDGGFEVCLDLKPGMDAEQLAGRLAKVARKQSLSNRLRKGAGLSPQAISVWRDFTPQLPPDDAGAGAQHQGGQPERHRHPAARPGDLVGRRHCAG